MRPDIHAPNDPPAAGTRRWRDRIAHVLAAGLAATLVACGGGGDVAGVGTGGTGSLAVGSISGFGSIIVNGVRYDDSASSVFDDDGNRSSSDALKLGMVVEVRGTLNDDGLGGTASSIVYASELKGPVTAVDPVAGTVTVFGLVVRVNAATVFEDVANGLAGLAVGNVVEVYALPDAGGQLLATRIEREALTVDAFGGDYRVRGAVSGLSGAGSALRFTVATVTVTTDAGTRIDGTVQEGAYVSVRLNKSAAGDGSYAASRVQVKSRGYDDSVDEAEIEGFVSGFTAADQPFEVNGYPVRLGSTVEYDDGVPGDLVDGALVEVEGTVSGGVLVVTKVEFKREDGDDDGGDDGSDAPFEFKGVADCQSCGPDAGTFVVRGVTVRYDAATRFDDGVPPANLDGSDVEVKAVAETGASGTTYRATRIEPND